MGADRTPPPLDSPGKGGGGDGIGSGLHEALFKPVPRNRQKGEKYRTVIGEGDPRLTGALVGDKVPVEKDPRKNGKATFSAEAKNESVADDQKSGIEKGAKESSDTAPPSDKLSFKPDSGNRGSHVEIRDDKVARDATKYLVDAGIDPDEVLGHHPDRPRAEKMIARSAEFTKSMRKDAVKAATEFALKNGGKENLMTFTETYQYYKLEVDRLISEKEKRGISKADSRSQTAKELPGIEQRLSKQLAKDLQKAEEIGSGPLWGTENMSPDQAREHARENASVLGFRSRESFAYHARKHHEELPAHAKNPDDPLGAYQQCLQETLAKGTVVDIEPNFRGGEGTRIVIRHALENNRKLAGELEAIMFVHPGGRMVISTFGAPKALRSDH